MPKREFLGHRLARRYREVFDLDVITVRIHGLRANTRFNTFRKLVGNTLHRTFVSGGLRPATSSRREVIIRVTGRMQPMPRRGSPSLSEPAGPPAHNVQARRGRPLVYRA